MNKQYLYSVLYEDYETNVSQSVMLVDTEDNLKTYADNIEQDVGVPKSKVTITKLGLIDFKPQLIFTKIFEEVKENEEV